MSEITSKSMDDVVEALFPGSCYVPGPNPEAGSTGFWLIPGGGPLPRWILPVGYARLFYSVLRRWRPYGRLSRLKWELICIAYRLNFLRFLPEVEQIGVRRNDGQAHVFDGDQLFITYVGTSGPSQKLVCTSIGGKNGEANRVIKIPLGDKAQKSIMHEAKALDALEKAFHAVAPRLLKVDGQHGYSEQEFIKGTLSPKKMNSEVIRFLTELKHDDLKYDLCSVYAQVLEIGSKLQDCFEADVSLLVTLAKKFSELGSAPAVWQHGDFAPWNIIIQNERAIAIDWEFSERVGFPSYDLVYFFSMQAQLFGHDFWDSEVFESSLRYYLGAVGVDAELWREFALVSLVLNSVLSARAGEVERFRYLIGQIRATKISCI